MESMCSSNYTCNIHRPSTREKEVGQTLNTMGKIAKRRQLRKCTHAQIQILANFYSITQCFATKKIRIFRAIFIAFPPVEYPQICQIVEHISVLPTACFQTIHRTKFEIEEKTQNCFDFLNFKEMSIFDLSEKYGKMTYHSDDQSQRRYLNY